MLKWAVNSPRKSYLPEPDELEEHIDCACACYVHSGDVDEEEEEEEEECGEFVVRSCYSRRSLSTIGAHVLTTLTTTVTGDRRLHRRKSFDVRTLGPQDNAKALVVGARGKQRQRQSITYISESTLI